MFNARVVLASVALVLLFALSTWLLAPRLLPGLRAPAAGGARVLPSLLLVERWVQGGAPPAAPGKPVVVLLWSDSDPRALAALPVLDAWAHGWGEFGVTVAAVHEPEFSFAADTTVPARIARRLAPSLAVGVDPGGRFAAGLGGMTEGARLLVADEQGRIVVDTVGVLEPGEQALTEWLARALPERLPPMRVAAALPQGVRSVGPGRRKRWFRARWPDRGGTEQVFVAPCATSGARAVGAHAGGRVAGGFGRPDHPAARGGELREHPL
jgi:hypothetical protein